jgi:hypothetical protein
MLVTIPRILGVIASIQACYLGIDALLYFSGMPPDEPVGDILWRAFWPVVLACGAYALWTPRPSGTFWEAVIRTIFIWLVIVANVIFIVSFLS